MDGTQRPLSGEGVGKSHQGVVYASPISRNFHVGQRTKPRDIFEQAIGKA